MMTHIKKILGYMIVSLLLCVSGIQIIAFASSEKVITAVEIPCDYTELYVNMNVAKPIFYDTLDCIIDGAATTVSGFTWMSEDYVANQKGIYTYVAVAPKGYQFADGLTPTITVRVRPTGVTALKARSFYYTSTYPASTVYDNNITGLYATAVPSGDSGYPSFIFDATGKNKIYSNTVSTKINLAGGLDHSKDNGIGTAYSKDPIELTSRIELFGTQLNALFGGSVGNVYKGTSDIYVTDGNLVNGIYAGSVNGDFEGTTNIYLSGDCTIPMLYFGSVYQESAMFDGTIVGKETVSYKGTVNVYIADDFIGKIGDIVFPIGDGNSVEANIHMSSACEFDIFSVGCKGATLYIDGEKYEGVMDPKRHMSEVTYSGEKFIVVSKGTDKSEIKFDGKLELIYGGNQYVEESIEWDCVDYSSTVAGVYMFTPVLKEKYDYDNEVELPQIEVLVAEEGGIQIESIDVGVALKTRIPKGINELNTPEKAVITYTYEGETHTAEIEISYSLANYKAKKGEYTLSIGNVQAPFALPADVSKSADIIVNVVNNITHKKSGNVYCFDNAIINVVANARGDYEIKDAAELYTYYDDVDVIYAIEMSGDAPCLIIESPLVYVESDITFKDIKEKANVDVARSLVTKIRTECPDKVMLNGILLDEFSEKTVTEISEIRGKLYLNGIPTIIMRGEDGGTYAYRSYDMVKLSETNLAGWDVSGGSYGEDSVTPVTNVRFESGMVYRIFGAGHGTTLDATLVMDGGAASDSTYGGAMKEGTVLRATVVYEYGDSKHAAYLGGVSGSILGDPDKVYAEGEYSAEVWYFDYSVHYAYLGGKDGGSIYGNIKFEQYDGRHLYLYTGGAGTKSVLNGDVDITVYGGIWEKHFEQLTTHHGNVKLRLYEGIHLEENSGYPAFKKLNGNKYTQEIEYFESSDNFTFVEYFDKREDVIDTSEDAGKLVVRVLENKINDGTDKGKVKIRGGSGDTIYITFPNGQNMLIDTGYQEGGRYIVKDLQDLGVTKIDYFMISHKDTDHVGALVEICKAFEVDTFLYQDYVALNQNMTYVVSSEEAEVIYLGEGDTIDIGEVHIDIINPDPGLIGKYSDRNDTSIAMVMTYGDSKSYFGADCSYHIEAEWLANEEMKELLSDCTLAKLNHHGIQNANTPEFLALLNADNYVMTQMGEYGTKAGHTVASLQGALGVSLENIYITGRHGMIKAVLNKDGTVDMSSQYVKTTPYYADYSKIDALIESVDESKLSAEKLELWKTAVGRVKNGYLYEEQGTVDGVFIYLSELADTITKGNPLNQWLIPIAFIAGITTVAVGVVVWRKRFSK